MDRTRWFQQMNEIGLLPPAVDLTHIMEEDDFEFEHPSRSGHSNSTSVPRPLAHDERGPTKLALSTSFLDSTLRAFLDYHDMGPPDAGGDLPPRASEDENEDTAVTSEAANPATATRCSFQSDSSHSTDARRKRKRTDAAPLFAPSANSKRSRSDGTLVPAYPCARCIEQDLECRICYVGGACNVCRARGRKCDLVDPETKHTHTGSITKNLLKRHGGRLGGKNSKAPAGKLKL
ncbi:hypothetical protein EXIGLDRAFT_832206 [Exidia glandulosa HHB12029]|uniref:Uncharacterized protein n=1 Tax=Exidia glandulosa HHB12029 TaxID=1314781 RepID=A0A165LW18_EXIGL|nr:hypothetical protein EXIGLDRAFT_832206 [Exidia glandulosa HHB12029]